MFWTSELLLINCLGLTVNCYLLVIPYKINSSSMEFIFISMVPHLQNRFENKLKTASFKTLGWMPM